MDFKEYLNELNNIDVAQARTAHEPTNRSDSSIHNPEVKASINQHLNSSIAGEPIMNPHEGMQRVRKVLHMYGFDLPALYFADHDGDELDFELYQYGRESEEPDAFLYLIYVSNKMGSYDFYAEVVDSEELNAIYEAGDHGQRELEDELDELDDES